MTVATPPDGPGHLTHVLIIGTGLIGTSIALALRRRNVVVHLQDLDPAMAEAAAERGAGLLERPSQTVDLAVLAVPPSAVGPVLAEAQRRSAARAYTDVAGTKALIYRDITAAGGDLSCFVGGHPMSGSERSGPAAARADLFEGRPWVLTTHEAASPVSPRVQNTVERLVEFCGAEPLTMDARAHDRAAALVSHAPHLISTLMAAQLGGTSTATTAIAGPGLRDVVRTAGGSPDLWADILHSNAAAVIDVLEPVAIDLAATIATLKMLAGGQRRPDRTALRHLTDFLQRGRAGHERWKADNT